MGQDGRRNKIRFVGSERTERLSEFHHPVTKNRKERNLQSHHCCASKGENNTIEVSERKSDVRDCESLKLLVAKVVV